MRKNELIALVLQIVAFATLLTLLLSNYVIGQKLDIMIELLKQIAAK